MTEAHETIEAAATRLDRAFTRLEASLSVMHARFRTQARVQVDTQKLLAERARFASDLERASSRARRLEDANAEVARRLVVAMDSVNAVLQDG
jgi:hypothetical protein